MTPGDDIVIHRGRYSESVVVRSGGNPDARVVIRTADDGEVVVDGSGVDVDRHDTLFLIRDATDVTLRGFTIANSGANCLTAARTARLQLEDLRIEDCGASGIFIADSTGPARTSIRRSQVARARQGGIVLWTNPEGYFLVEDNVVHHIAGVNNFDGIQGNDSPYTVIRGNTLYAMGDEGDYIDCGGDQTSPTSHAHHIVYDRNLIYVGDGGRADGLKLNNRPRRAILRRNIVEGKGAIFYEQPHAQVAVYANTFVNASGHALQLWNANREEDFAGIVVRNNLFAGARQALIQHAPKPREGSPPAIVMDGNAYRFTGGGIDWVDGETSVSVAGTRGGYESWRTQTGQEPRGGLFLETSALFENRDARDYTPKASSPLIDAAVPLTTTRSSGRGRWVPVHESFFFFDGYGMVDGDTIVVGNNAPARVVEVDEVAERLGLDREISFAEDDPVTLPFAGAAPDIGARERD